MTTTSIPPVFPAARAGPSPIVLHDVTWEQYEELLQGFEGHGVFLTYDEGTLEMMFPLPLHERYKKLIARFIEALTEELDIPMIGLGSTTFRREDRGAGLEPDECFYVQNVGRLRDRLSVDHDPPPDLAVEIDISRHAVARERVYARLGVPEVWSFDGERLVAFALEGGAYREIPASRALPMLPLAEVVRFLGRAKAEDDTAIARAFRRWVRENLAKPGAGG